MTEAEAFAEAREAVAFYESRGWNWLTVVAFIHWKAIGMPSFYFPRQKPAPSERTER